MSATTTQTAKAAAPDTGTATQRDTRAVTQRGPLARFFDALKRQRTGVVLAGVYLVVVALACLVPQLFTSADPIQQDLLAVNQAPSLEHIAGTDYLGRDLFARIVYGARYSIGIGIAVTLISLFFGAIIGLLAGTARSRVIDTAFMRAIDVLSSFPSVLLALIIVGLTGAGVPNLIVALGVAGIPTFARMIRAETKSVVLSEYVEQSITFGLPRWKMLLRHVLPNSLGVIPYMVTISLGGAIMGVSALSFLGIGPQPPTPEWGTILAESRNFLRVAWWSGILPGIVLVLTVISFTVVGRAWQASFERKDR